MTLSDVWVGCGRADGDFRVGSSSASPDGRFRVMLGRAGFRGVTGSEWLMYHARTMAVSLGGGDVWMGRTFVAIFGGV